MKRDFFEGKVIAVTGGASGIGLLQPWVTRYIIDDGLLAGNFRLLVGLCALMLGIAYAANIGGTATIIGTPPNVVFAGYIRQTFDFEVSFANWMIVGLPWAGRNTVGASLSR
mgnify:CR=1 FL=1